jgi:hypothetical protein
LGTYALQVRDQLGECGGIFRRLLFIAGRTVNTRMMRLEFIKFELK